MTLSLRIVSERYIYRKQDRLREREIEIEREREREREREGGGGGEAYKIMFSIEYYTHVILYLTYSTSSFFNKNGYKILSFYSF